MDLSDALSHRHSVAINSLNYYWLTDEQPSPVRGFLSSNQHNFPISSNGRWSFGFTFMMMSGLLIKAYLFIRFD